MSTVARSFRIKKSIDDSVTALMGEEHRSRNNMIEILLEEALALRMSPQRPAKKRVVAKKPNVETRH